MAESFFYASPFAEYGIDKDKVDELILAYLESDKRERITLLLTDGETSFGMLAAGTAENHFNYEKTAFELVFWIDEEYRNWPNAVLLLKTYEYWAKTSAKAQIVSLSLLDEKTSILYRRYGYQKTEQSYSKRL